MGSFFGTLDQSQDRQLAMPLMCATKGRGWLKNGNPPGNPTRRLRDVGSRREEQRRANPLQWRTGAV